MPARNFILDRFEHDIRHRILEEGHTIKLVHAWLRSENVTVDLRTLTRRCQRWGIRQKTSASANDPILIDAIRTAFHDSFDDDDAIVTRVLQQTGIYTTARHVQSIRLRRGWRRNTRSITQREQEGVTTTDFVRHALQNGVARQYGREYTQTHLRLQYGHQARSHHVEQALRLLDPVGTEERRPGPRRRRRKGGEFIVRGPDRLWCIDGHDKFRNYGIFIYAAIDAYSRKIIWFYIGTDNRLGVGVLHQLLLAAKRMGRLPRRFRSDKGKETILAADAVYSFRLKLRPESTFRDCWWYGTSTANIKIELSWHQSIVEQTESWIVSEMLATLLNSHPLYLYYASL